MASPHQRLLAQAERSLGGRQVAEVVGRVRAIVGPVELPGGEAEAEAALRALKNGEIPTARQLAALQMVIKLLRPAVLSRGGALDPLPTYNEYNSKLLDDWQAFQEKVRPYLYSVGRIDRASDGESFGTGFLVAKNLVLTNRHVVKQLSFGTGELEPGSVEIRFGEEYGAPSTIAPVPIQGVVAIHERLDMALLRIDQPSDRAPLRWRQEDLTAGMPVVAIGYPFSDSERNPLFMEAIYSGIYGVKRASPGEVVELRSEGFDHDCSTLGGSSGSPVFALDSAEVVGLHASGMFLYVNEALPADAASPFIAANASNS